MNTDQVHEAALKLERLANLYHSVNRQVAVDDKTPDEIEEAMMRLYEVLPDQPIGKESSSHD